MSKNVTRAKRALTVTMSAALIISLSACSGATNNYGKLDENAVYAKVTAGSKEYKVTNGDVWNELKWNAQDLLSESINNVVLDEQITNITVALAKNFGDLSDSEKTNLGVESEDDFKTLKQKYEDRLVDYVVQDVYSFEYKTESYWSNLEKMEEVDAKIAVYKYVDSMYSNYQKKTVGNENLATLLENAYILGAEDNKETYLKVGKEFSGKYYPLLAKELLAYKTLKETVDKDFEEDEDAEDTKIGHYEQTSYVSKFKGNYTNKHDLDLVAIRFASSDEYNNILRAFGVKVYNKRFYFIADNKNLDNYDSYLSGDSRKTMQDYIDMYKDFSSSNLTRDNGAIELSGEEVLELFIQIYNYSYSGYRTPLSSTVITKDTVIFTDNTGADIKADYANLSLNSLRNVTYRITELYNQDPQAKYNANVESLKTNNATETTFYSETLKEDYSDTFKVYMYETLKLTDDNGNVDMHARYTTTTQSAANGYYAVYKFDEEKDLIEGEEISEDLKKYQEFYKPSLSNYEILTYIQNDENKSLFNAIVDALMQDDITSDYISTTLSDKIKDVKVSIYNEAVEIGYKVKNTDYSNTVMSAANKNVLATFKYDDKVFNLNIVSDAEDENTLKVPGTTNPVGAYNVLEASSGAETAVGLISRQMIKDTKEYEDALNDKDANKNYETYLENMLIYFSNDYYSSNGYPASIGKYNYLMLNYHTADVKAIIRDNFLFSLASSKLLTDFSSTKLAEFFKKYADMAYDKYFSLGDTRVLVYFDRDDDDTPDEIDATDPENWVNEVVSFDGLEVTREFVAKQLVLDIYNELAKTSTKHTTQISTIVSEINNSSKAVYEENPINSENKWAKYRYLGFKVTEKTDNVTNATTSINFDLKQRLYDYAKGQNDAGTKEYQFFVNDTVPTAYMELLNQDNVSVDDDTIVETNEGYNLIVVTSGTAKATAKWEEDDKSNSDLLTDIKLKYNEEIVKVENIYNSEDKLNLNQILLYTLDYRVNGSSTLSPTSIADALTNYLKPVYDRFTNSATQTIVLLNYIKKVSGKTGDLYSTVEYTNEAYNGENGIFAEFIRISQDTADSYSAYIDDTTGTSRVFEDWWDELYEHISSFTTNKEAN